MIGAKKILITGKDSYIGTSVKDWLVSGQQMIVDEVCVKDKDWRDIDFSSFSISALISAFSI